jgi:hypothetical protein
MPAPPDPLALILPPEIGKSKTVELPYPDPIPAALEEPEPTSNVPFRNTRLSQMSPDPAPIPGPNRAPTARKETPSRPVKVRFHCFPHRIAGEPFPVAEIELFPDSKTATLLELTVNGAPP